MKKLFYSALLLSPLLGSTQNSTLPLYTKSALLGMTTHPTSATRRPFLYGARTELYSFSFPRDSVRYRWVFANEAKQFKNLTLDERISLLEAVLPFKMEWYYNRAARKRTDLNFYFDMRDDADPNIYVGNQYNENLATVIYNCIMGNDQSRFFAFSMSFDHELVLYRTDNFKTYTYIFLSFSNR